MKKFSIFKLSIAILLGFISFMSKAQTEIAVAKNYLNQNALKEKISTADSARMEVSSSCLSPSTGWYHLYFKQMYEFIEVHNGILNTTLKNGNVAYVSDSFIPNLESSIQQNPSITTQLSYRTPAVFKIASPILSGTNNPRICINTSASLTATCSAGTPTWYDANSVAIPFAGSPYNTPNLAVNTTYKVRCEDGGDLSGFTDVEVIVNNPPTPIIPVGSTTIPICLNNSTQLTATGCSGSGLNLRWFDASDDSEASLPVSPTITSQYYATCEIYNSDETVCSSSRSETVEVVVLDPPTPTPALGLTICSGNSRTLTATGCTGINNALKWFNASDNSSVTMPVSPTVTTDYYAKCETTINSVSCLSSASSNVTITVNRPATPLASGANICRGNSVTLTATGCSGVGDVLKWYRAEFEGSPTLVTMPVSPTTPTIYVATCTTTLNSVTCTSPFSFSVFVFVNTATPPTITGTSVCVGNTVNLTSSVAGSYAWTGVNGFTSTDQNPNIANATVSNSGTYRITVTNVNGCTASAETLITVNPNPVATASNNSPICVGNTLNLTGGGIGTYAWTSSNSFTSTDQNPSIPNASILASGTYRITVTNVNGCTASAETSVTVNPLVNPPVPQANTQIIFGASITLTATGCSGVNDVLKWYQSADNLLVTMPVSPTATTNYYAKCETTLNGITCISGNSVNVTVTVLNLNPPVALGTTNCIGTPTTLTATGCSGSVGTFVLKWYQNSNDALITMPVSPLVSTDYYAKCEQTFNAVTTVSAKSNVVTLTILNPPTPVSTGGTIYSNQSIALTATGCTGIGLTLKWYQTADNLIVTMPVSPTVTTQYYSKCEQTINSITCLSPKSNDVTVKVINRIFVDITKISAPIQNGNAWATAYGNLQTGLAAATAGVEVWVAKGTYKPTTTTDRSITFNIPNNVIVYDGFFGTEDNLIDRNFSINISILNGEIGDLNTMLDNIRHVVTFNGSSTSTIFDGFTITGGNANFDPKHTVFYPIAPITELLSRGGGITVENAGNPVITNCIFINNFAVTGGGLFAGDNSKPTITACKFIGNLASFGAGMYFQDGGHAKIDNTLISGNRSIGAIYNNYSNPTITNCTFGGNGGYNGGIFNSNSQPIMKNSIVWGNSTPFNDTQTTISYSTIQGGYAGIGNLSVDPKYVSQTPEGLSPSITGDYHVQASSLTID